MNRILETHDLGVKFGFFSILEKLNLHVDQGETLAILGPNGSGKTTMFRAILGLIPHSGEVLLFGQNASVRRDVLPFVGYVPQKIEFEPIFPASVADVVAMGLTASKKSRRGIDMVRKAGYEYYPRSGESARQRVERALDAVGMLRKKNLRVSALSGGERQRVFVAHALIKDPLLMICDEPVSSADVESQEAFYNIMEDAYREYGITTILSLHDLDMVKKHSTKIACINCHLLFHGDNQDFFANNKLIKAYTDTTMHEPHHIHE